MQQATTRGMTAAASALALILGGIVGGCASPQQEAQGAARDFLAAAQDGNAERAAQTLTVKARPHVGTSMQWVRDEDASGAQGFTLGETYISGDTARVPVTLTDGDGGGDADLHLRREDGRWRVCGIELKSGVGPTLDVDFERPEDTIGSAFRTAGQALGLFARGMEEGAKQFERGFDEGYKSGAKNDKPHGKPSVRIEEVTPPRPTPGGVLEL